MDQLHPTPLVYLEILHEQRQQALRGCDDRTYAFLCRRRLEDGPRGGRARILGRLTTLLRIVQRRGHTDRAHETPDPAARDPDGMCLQDEPVVCIDLGNPLAGASKPSSSPAYRSDPDSAHRGKG